MRVSRQWSHLEILRIFGFGHDTDKIPGPGDLAWFCVACPQQGVNLPDDWQEQEDQSVIVCFLVLYTILNSIQVEIHAVISYGWKLQG